MELHQLKYFSCVAKYESMSKAALELHITQPALSKSIAKLETELGCELFDRSCGRFSLTDSGRFFRKYVDQTLHVLKDGVQAMRSMSEGVEESVRIGVFGPQRAALECIDAFMGEYPDVKITIESKQPFKGQPLMHEFEVVFYPEGSSFDSLAGSVYAHTSFSAIVAPDHPLARCNMITMEDLRDEPLILINSTSGVLEKTYRLCEEAGYYPNVRAIVTNRVAQSLFVRNGRGIGITDGAFPSVEFDDVVVVELDTNIPSQALCVSFRNATALPSAARHFVDFAASYFDIKI